MPAAAGQNQIEISDSRNMFVRVKREADGRLSMVTKEADPEVP